MSCRAARGSGSGARGNRAYVGAARGDGREPRLRWLELGVTNGSKCWQLAVEAPLMCLVQIRNVKNLVIP